MAREAVAFGVADTHYSPPRIKRDPRHPTTATRKEVEGKVLDFNRRRDNKNRFAVATIYHDGSYDLNEPVRNITGWQLGLVKWFNDHKGYGFVVINNDTPDIFVHVYTLQECGLETLEQGDLVRVRYGQSAKGLFAVEIAKG